MEKRVLIARWLGSDTQAIPIYDEASDSWKLVPGTYTFMVGGSSQSLPLVEKVNLK